MPLFKNALTGQEQTLTDDYVSAFPAGTWERLSDEAPEEVELRKRREAEEAIRNKVELEDEIPAESPAAVQENAQADDSQLELGVIHHDNQEG